MKDFYFRGEGFAFFKLLLEPSDKICKIGLVLEVFVYTVKVMVSSDSLEERDFRESKVL
jgi:hypothetical protein